MNSTKKKTDKMKTTVFSKEYVMKRGKIREEYIPTDRFLDGKFPGYTEMSMLDGRKIVRCHVPDKIADVILKYPSLEACEIYLTGEPVYRFPSRSERINYPNV